MSASFHSLATQAREQRLEGPNHDGGEFPLIGYCFDNAYVLYHILEENGYSPTFVVGTTNRYADDLVQDGVDLDEDIDCIEDLAGLVHYWVEVDGTLIDIASDTWDNLGEIVITDELPAEYHRYPDSYQEGNDALRTVRGEFQDRCSYCGAHVSSCSH